MTAAARDDGAGYRGRGIFGTADDAGSSTRSSHGWRHGAAEASAAVSALKADPANYASVFAADLSAKCA